MGLAPWLSVRDSDEAARFYKAAFGAEEVYRLPEGSPTESVVQLRAYGAEFWIGGTGVIESEAENVGGGTVRMILTVDDPDAVFAQALAAGASQVFPVGEAHGWRLGRLADPFGLHWEIGRPVRES